jgi:DNA modification methylase
MDLMTTPTARIITGDCLDIIPTLDDGSIDLVVTSPPYPGQYGNEMNSPAWLYWTSRWLQLLERKLTLTGVIALNVAFKRTDRGWYDSLVFNLGHPGWTRYNILDIYIYGKSNPPPNGALTYCDPPGWEYVFILTNASRPEDVTFNPVRPYSANSLRANGNLYSSRTATTEAHPDGARQTTLMRLSSSADQNRPRAKGISFPRTLPERFIRQYTNPGDTVLDPFCGVGTTVRVAHELGRRAIGIEIDPDEADTARAWLAEPTQPVLFSI